MVLNLNYDKIKELTYQATQTTFLKVKEEKSQEVLYVFSLDIGQYRRILPCYNTEEALIRSARKYILNEENYPMDNDSIGEVSRWIRWNPGDWEYLGFSADSDAFNEVNQILKDVPEKLMELEDMEFTFTCQILEDILLVVLSELDSEGLFGKGSIRNSIVLMLAELDTDVDKQLETLKRLNPPEVYERVREDLAWRDRGCL
ncbi:DUF4303 domain-containing protein [Roseofilum casamattae]|uniref:DUF4303 domain-containing protein n=1 Tax=Roseofilum casamattae BLCC-M143 TaxID=3022442 RepID=A0ABT7BXF3_9CYAN|nr:DUF4303 domain-containing protein [Roseofilum casamattae]MDJ1183872.1 DUF4303 domain-containing protein [Roseofilum casamattae BLCC-M143]